jgi:ribosomal-protein-alanine N-acetyltransferase
MEERRLQETYGLRKFDMNDLQSVMQINRSCLPENYTDSFFVDLYKRFPETFIVADEDNHIVGYIMCRVEVGLSKLGLSGLIKKGHVVSVAVKPEHRRRGIGSALVSKALEAMKLYNAKQCYLEVRVSNEEAVRLYRKLGFEISQTVHGYYADGEGAFVMTKKL